MTKISDVINIIENLAPLNLASSWDNSGWQISLGDKEINKVLLALTPTLDVIEQAIDQKVELLISHHPLMFNKINKLSTYSSNDLPVIKAIQNNLQIYSAHTNLDSAQNGIADVLGNFLGLKNLEPIEKITENTGLGRIGVLEKQENINTIVEKIKNILNIDKLKLINPSNKVEIKTVALCPGSGGDFINILKDIDLYITADIKYHQALEVNNFAVIDAGHFETERIILPVLQSLIEKQGIEVLIANEIIPWKIL